MAVQAGDTVRAVHLNPLVDSLPLPDGLRPTATTTFEDWGDPIIFANPGRPVTVKALGTGQATCDSDGTGVAMRVGISVDGGATWSFGIGPRDQTGGGVDTRRAAFAAMHHITTEDVPTGDVRVKAQFEATTLSSGNPTFYFGTILGEVIAR